MAGLASLLDPSGYPAGYAGYLDSRKRSSAEEQQNLQQATGLMGLMQAQQGMAQKQAAAARQAQAEAALRALPPDAGPEEVTRTLRPFAGVDTALRTASDTQNRTAQREQRIFEIEMRGQQEMEKVREQLREGRITKQDAFEREERLKKWTVEQQIQARKDMLRMAAALRPPRQERVPQWRDIEDPRKPGSMITVNPEQYDEAAYMKGDNKGVLGRAKSMTQAGAIDAKTNLTMTGLGSDLQSAEDLLTGVTRTSDGQVVKGNKPTGSGIGAAYDAAAGFFGATPAGAAEADSLKVVAARLTQRIPRFEGPQSDKDLALYKQAAGDVGNEKLPIPRRLAAAKTMRSLYAGYESGQRGRLIGNRRATDNSGSSDEPPPGAVRRRDQ